MIANQFAKHSTLALYQTQNTLFIDLYKTEERLTKRESDLRAIRQTLANLGRETSMLQQKFQLKSLIFLEFVETGNQSLLSKL